MSQPTGQSAQDVQDFLKSLDELGAPPTSSSKPSTTTAARSSATPAGSSNANPQDAQSVLDFLDEITQRSATPIAPVPEQLNRSDSKSSLRASTSNAGAARRSTDIARERALSNSPRAQASPRGPSPTLSRTPTTELPRAPAPAAPAAQPAAAGWGWSSAWSAATNVVQQARSVAEQARTVAEENLTKNMPAGARPADMHKWREGVMGLVKQGIDVEKLGHNLKEVSMRTLTDVMNAVAPPIAEHEVITVTLSHDMIGYEGVEALVYRALAKIMEQVEGGDLVVNAGKDDTAGATPATDDERQIGAVPGFDAAHKLADSSLKALIDAAPAKEKSEPGHARSDSNPALVPVTVCQVYMRVQPCLAALPLPAAPGAKEAQQHLFFLLILRDPEHDLEHSTLTQAMPAAWLDIPFEEVRSVLLARLTSQNEWVEDRMVEVIRAGVEVIGQEYVHARQNGRQRAAQAAIAASSAQPTTDDTVAAASASAGL